MKRIIVTSLLVILLVPGVLAAQETAKFRVDVGAGLSFAMIDGDTIGDDSEFGDAAGLFLTLLSLRGGLNGTVRYQITNSLSAGAEVGVYTMSAEDSTGGTSYSFIDFPVRAVIRFGSGSTYIQGFGGYYVSVNSPIFGGVEGGAKLSLGGLYVAASYTMGDLEFMRYELGYNLTNLLEF